MIATISTFCLFFVFYTWSSKSVLDGVISSSTTTLMLCAVFMVLAAPHHSHHQRQQINNTAMEALR
jgi:uncharacterized MnhB-related membrane protein